MRATVSLRYEGGGVEEGECVCVCVCVCVW